tara:strand:- start:203 stop:355 length:153 start_codon:yes stop_codon:yes gene_type:complete
MIYIFIIIAFIIIARNFFTFQANKNSKQEKSNYKSRFDEEIQDADFEEIN